MNDNIPAPIEERLRKIADGMMVLVPSAIDEAILSRARERFAEIRRRRAKVQCLWWASAAAVLVTMGFVASAFLNAPSYERADIDRNGRVDILDAFALARRIQQGNASGLDFNNDGVVDRADVDAVAARAVKLKKGSA